MKRGNPPGPRWERPVVAGARLSSATPGGAVARRGGRIRAAPLSGRSGVGRRTCGGLASVAFVARCSSASDRAHPGTMVKRDNRVVSIRGGRQWGDLGCAGGELDPWLLPAGPEGQRPRPAPETQLAPPAAHAPPAPLAPSGPRALLPLAFPLGPLFLNHFPTPPHSMAVPPGSLPSRTRASSVQFLRVTRA